MRKWLLLALGLLTGLVALAGLSLTLPRKSAAEEMYDRIKVGMDEREAMAILTADSATNTRFRTCICAGGRGADVLWRDLDSGRAVLSLNFDGDRRVASKEYYPPPTPARGWWQSLRDRLGW